jgi:hypothetical protein
MSGASEIILARIEFGIVAMRTIVGWSIKLSVAGLLYVGMTSGFKPKLPDEVLGFKVPAAAQQFIDRNAEIADLGQKTTAGFKGIADAFK